jgi:hypothetical protein
MNSDIAVCKSIFRKDFPDISKNRSIPIHACRHALSLQKCCRRFANLASDGKRGVRKKLSTRGALLHLDKVHRVRYRIFDNQQTVSSLPLYTFDRRYAALTQICADSCTFMSVPCSVAHFLYFFQFTSNVTSSLSRQTSLHSTLFCRELKTQQEFSHAQTG